MIGRKLQVIRPESDSYSKSRETLAVMARSAIYDKTNISLYLEAVLKVVTTDYLLKEVKEKEDIVLKVNINT